MMASNGRSTEVSQVRSEEQPAWLGGQIDQVERVLANAMQELGDRITEGDDKRDAKLNRIYQAILGLLTAVVVMLIQAVVSGAGI